MSFPLYTTLDGEYESIGEMVDAVKRSRNDIPPRENQKPRGSFVRAYAITDAGATYLRMRNSGFAPQTAMAFATCETVSAD
jgi:hypothetical protein